ncbi:MAG: hypothetical protein IPK44_13040 [Candidatus Accumulibacter sp.]|uniref:hypothetical protein n=1 Tax=Accumulibacter sp. TaxID=2053492 RepID=UPI002588586D|nr:hypothetical protein [Accumulibacter sp.]MBK8115380.1 hypothetical protein [Accumulibacter sp.]
MPRSSASLGGRHRRTAHRRCATPAIDARAIHAKPEKPGFEVIVRGICALRQIALMLREFRSHLQPERVWRYSSMPVTACN